MAPYCNYFRDETRARVDNCLWDVIGKYRREPVYRVLGGPVKDRIRAYASMLGHSLEPKLITERVQQKADLGYTA